MTTTTLPPQSPLSTDSSVTDDWDSLPDSEPLITLPPPVENKPDAVGEEKAPTPGVCAACGETITRAPGARGRMPKYHPDCRPIRSVNTGSVASGRSTKAEREADECIRKLRSGAMKVILMLSMLNKFDAFCIMVNLPTFFDNLRGVLIRYESFRREVLAASAGGSIFGLGLAVLMMGLPIAANHRLIRSRVAVQVLMNAPFTLHKLNTKLAEGEAGLTNLMNEQLEEMQRAREEAAQRAKAAANDRT